MDGAAEPTNGAPTDANRLSRAVGVLGQIIAPTTLITVLLVYFGWARTSAVYGVFGIDWAVLGFSTQDYVFRSIGTAFTPAIGLLLAFLVAVPAHDSLLRLLAKAKRRDRPRLVAKIVVGLVTGIGVVLAALGVLGVVGAVRFRTAWPVVPLMLGFGVLLLGYAPTLYHAATGSTLGGDRRSPPHVALRIVFGTFLVLCLFWAVAVYGQKTGVEEAVRIASEPRALPGVIIYSPQSLKLDAPGLVETPLPGDDSRYRYRYDGLRLLVRGVDRYVLLPATWRPGMRAIVLHDDPALRLEFFLGSRPQA
jgi:hypothetical protein